MPIKAEAARACVIVADAPFAGAPLDCRVQQLHWLIGQLHEIISAIIDVQHEPVLDPCAHPVLHNGLLRRTTRTWVDPRQGSPTLLARAAPPASHPEAGWWARALVLRSALRHVFLRRILRQVGLSTARAAFSAARASARFFGIGTSIARATELACATGLHMQ